MKLFILQFIIILGFASLLWADDTPSFSLTSNEVADVRQKLEAYEKGTMNLDELTLNGGEEGSRELIGYYLSHSNNVTVKMKLPISRSFAAFNKYQEAAKLSAGYVQVYSNDWHGWKILGGASIAMGNYNMAVEALTNATRLGDEYSYAPLAFAALKVDRLDIVSNIVQHMLALKKAQPPPEVTPLDIVTVLVLYSLKSDQQNVFIKALDGVGVQQILSRPDLKQLAETGCERFKGKAIDKIREEMESASSSTNSVSSPPR